MSADESAILQSLGEAQRERLQRAADPDLGIRTEALKAYQQARFRRTYADQFADPRYASAATFFVEELYGPGDFARRDADFASIVPALVRLFPRDLVATVAALAALHALSERLDSRMAMQIVSASIDPPVYAAAWRAACDGAERERQIVLVEQVGMALDRYARKPMLRQALRMMRGPARAAGLTTLQSLLERGLDSFAAMKGAEAFVQTIGQRERALSHALHAHQPGEPLPPWVLGQLP